MSKAIAFIKRNMPLIAPLVIVLSATLFIIGFVQYLHN